MGFAPGSVIGGKYRLERVLPRGGPDGVWVAHVVDEPSRAPVALKVVSALYAGGPTTIARLERDARAAAGIASPHLVRSLDFGVDGGRAYLVTELLEGEDLGARIARRGRLSLHEVAALLAQAGEGLRAIHDARAVHRDLRPAKLFLATNGGPGGTAGSSGSGAPDVDGGETLKILGLGVVGEAPLRLAQEGAGDDDALPYRSPEQLRGEKGLDAGADVWALGVILFRALTGRLPFAGELPSTIVSKILVAPVPAVRDLVPALPVELDGFFAKALARERARRFRSAGELVDELGRIAALAPDAAGVEPRGASRRPPPGAPRKPPGAGRPKRGPRSPAPPIDTLSTAGVTEAPSTRARAPRTRLAVSFAALAVLGAGALATGLRLRDDGSHAGTYAGDASAVDAVEVAPVEVAPVEVAPVEVAPVEAVPAPREPAPPPGPVVPALTASVAASARAAPSAARPAPPPARPAPGGRSDPSSRF